MAAGTTVARINTIVTANTTQFTAAMGKAQGTAGKFTERAGAAARAASGPLTLGLIGAGAAAVKAAVDFDNSMTKIESLVGIAGDEVDAMKESVRALSGETAQAPADLADAMFFIQSAGLRGAVAMETLDASAKAAAVGLGEVTEIADLATSALNAYGAENLSAVQATDVLTAAVREGKLEASELAGSMGRVLPIASAMGVRFDEVGAAFAALSRTGTNAAEAATQVRGILSSLLRPTKQAEEALTGMGLSSEGLRRQLREEGLLATLQTLAREFDGNSAAAASVFGNIRALSGVMDLMGANTATTEQIFANMRDTTGTLDEAFGVVSETAGFQFQQAMADLQERMIAIGETLIPVVLQMLEGVQFLIEGFQDMHPAALVAAAGLTALVVASGPIGQISLAVGGLMYVFGEMAGNAREAKERQEALTQEFVDADTPTHTMIGRMEELAAAIRDVADAADETAPEVDTIIGSSVALALALERDVLPEFDELGISMNDVAAAAESGTNAFEALQDVAENTGGSADSMRTSIRNLTGAEREMAEALIDAKDAGDINLKTLLDMLDVVDETADAFDDNRAVLEDQAEQLVDTGDAVRILNSIYLDGEGIIAGYQRQNLTNLEIMRRVDTLVQNHAESMNDLSVEAQRAGVATGELGDEVADAEGPTLELADALDEATESAKKLEDQFSDLMRTILGEGEALLNAQELAAEFDQIVADMAESTVPALARSFYDMAAEAASAIGRLVDEGARLDSPEVQAVFDNFISNLALIGLAGDRSLEDIGNAISALESMAGISIPVEVRLELFAPAFDVTAAQLADQIGAIYGNIPFTPTPPTASRPPTTSSTSNADYPFAFGAAGAIVRRPTMALIGEAGPEAVVPLNRMPGASPLPGGVGGGGDTHITINMPSGSNGDDVVRALQDYVRRRGSIPVPVGSARY